MGLCDTAGGMLKCGLENAPEAVAEIINLMENSLKVSVLQRN